MGYITNADIEERLGSATYVQLADDDGDGIADTGVVNEARLASSRLSWLTDQSKWYLLWSKLHLSWAAR